MRFDQSITDVPSNISWEVVLLCLRECAHHTHGVSAYENCSEQLHDLHISRENAVMATAHWHRDQQWNGWRMPWVLCVDVAGNVQPPRRDVSHCCYDKTNISRIYRQCPCKYNFRPMTGLHVTSCLINKRISPEVTYKTRPLLVICRCGFSLRRVVAIRQYSVIQSYVCWRTEVMGSR